MKAVLVALAIAMTGVGTAAATFSNFAMESSHAPDPLVGTYQPEVSAQPGSDPAPAAAPTQAPAPATPAAAPAVHPTVAHSAPAATPTAGVHPQPPVSTPTTALPHLPVATTIPVITPVTVPVAQATSAESDD